MGRRKLLPSHWHGRESKTAACRRPLPFHVGRPQLEGRRHGERLARGTRHLPQQGQDLPHLGEQEDQLRIISMQSGGDVRAVFDRLARGTWAVGDSVRAESGREFMLDPKLGYLHSCPTNLGTGMRASVHVDLPGWTKEGVPALKARCEELALQPRGTRGESGGQTGVTYDISNKHRLGYSEVQLVQTMIDGVNTLYTEDVALQKKHGIAEKAFQKDFLHLSFENRCWNQCSHKVEGVCMEASG